MDIEREKVPTHFRTEMSMKERLKLVSSMVKASSQLTLEIATKGTSPMEESPDSEKLLSSPVKMLQNIPDSG